MQKNKLIPNYEIKSLVLFGYIKKHCGIHLRKVTPDDVINAMILWFDLTDSLDSCLSHTESIHEWIILNDVLHQCFMIRNKERASSLSHYQSSFGSVIVKQGMRYKWRFRSFRKNSYVLGVALIGIIDVTGFDNLANKYQNIEKFWVRPYNGYAVDPYNQSKYRWEDGRQIIIRDWKSFDRRSNYMKYATMILDMIWIETAVLSFELEDKNGNVIENVVWKNIDIYKKYRMAACNLRPDRVLGLVTY